MPCASSIEEAVSLAEQRWPGIDLTIIGPDEAHGACPDSSCGAASEDGWILFSSGYFFCRPSNGAHTGWLDDDKPLNLTPEQKLLRQHEAEIKRLARQQTKLEKQLEAVKRMATCTDHEDYHLNACHDGEFWKWAEENGLLPETVFKYKIGKCNRCPTDPEHRPSYTLPIWRKDGPLWAIRHRLIGPDSGGRYRPHMAGLGLQLVGAPTLADHDKMVLVVEGAKKTYVVGQYIPNTVGILGKGGFEMRWLPWFHPSASICLMLDPDALDSAWKLGREIAQQGKRVYVASLPMKPDDMIIAGATREDLLAYANLARRVH